MVSELHGKRYYVVLNDSYEAEKTLTFISTLPELKDEIFGLAEKDGKYIIFSNAKCESFRGKKYTAWERVKQYIYYKLRKRES